MAYALASIALASAWVPLFVRFLQGWRNRKNPVSLAICAAISFLIYDNITTGLLALDMGSWQVARGLNLAFNAFVIVNFYISFRWSSQRFPEARRGTYSVPPTNATKGPPH